MVTMVTMDNGYPIVSKNALLKVGGASRLDGKADDTVEANKLGPQPIQMP